MAAERQGKFWPFHDKIFENYNKLSDKKIEEIAKELGLNMDKFKLDMKNPAVSAQIERDLQDGYRAEVRGTPTVFVNGRKPRDRSLKGFSAIIERELKKAAKK